MIANSKAEKGQDHAWFAVLRAGEAIPRSVVIVLVERGGKGGQVAAPIARKILNAIFIEKVAPASTSTDERVCLSPRRATARRGASERRGVWGAMSGPHNNVDGFAIDRRLLQNVGLAAAGRHGRVGS